MRRERRSRHRPRRRCRGGASDLPIPTRPAHNTTAANLATEMLPVSDTPAPALTEKPACFYLGRAYDLKTRQVLPGPEHIVEYDARNLTTHGVIIGMTGSGKTGLS